MSNVNISSRQRAREELAAWEERRRLAHVVLAGRLSNPIVCDTIIASARSMVSLWRERQLCSIDFIEAWDDLLTGPLEALVTTLGATDPTANRLRQNSPFTRHLPRW